MQVFDKFSLETEGCDEAGKHCTLAVMVLGQTMRALGETVHPTPLNLTP